MSFAGNVIQNKTWTSRVDGTVVNPGITFFSDRQTGFSRSSNVDVSIQGLQISRVHADGVTVYGTLAALQFAGSSGLISRSSVMLIYNAQVANVTYDIQDDTAVSSENGGFLILSGTNFGPGTFVTVGGDTQATSVTFISTSRLNVEVPAKNPGTYTLEVTRLDGATALLPLGITYSPVPVWGTDSILSVSTYTNFTITLNASSESPVTYALTSGSSLPTGTTLSSTGVISGFIEYDPYTTVYSFTIDAIDYEYQNIPRTFSLTPYILIVPITPTLSLDVMTLQLAHQSTVTTWQSTGQAATGYAVGSGTLPIYTNYTTDPRRGYVQLNGIDGGNGGYFNFGTTTWNVGTNGGFTYIAYVRFSTVNYSWERLFDFANGSPNNNIFFSRVADTSFLRFDVCQDASEYLLDASTLPIIGGTWQLVSARVQQEGTDWRFTVSVDGMSETYLFNGITFTNRTVTNSYVGRSNWGGDPYANISIREMLWYDAPLTDTQISDVSTYLQTKYIDPIYPSGLVTTFTTENPFTFTVSTKLYGNGTYTVIASSGDSLGQPFDNDNSTYYLSSAAYTNATGVYVGSTTTTIDGTIYYGEWYQIQLPRFIVLKRYIIGAVESAFSANAWVLAGSTDGIIWTLLDSKPSGSGTSTLTSFLNTEYAVVNSVSYMYYRMVALATISQDLWALGTFRLCS